MGADKGPLPAPAPHQDSDCPCHKRMRGETHACVREIRKDSWKRLPLERGAEGTGQGTVVCRTISL